MRMVYIFPGWAGVYVTSEWEHMLSTKQRNNAKNRRFCEAMGRRCVAARCSNTHSDNVSMHKFPKDPELRQKWEKQVQRTREQWSATEVDTGALLDPGPEVGTCLKNSVGRASGFNLFLFFRPICSASIESTSKQSASKWSLHQTNCSLAKGHQLAHLLFVQVVHQRKEWLLRSERDLG